MGERWRWGEGEGERERIIYCRAGNEATDLAAWASNLSIYVTVSEKRGHSVQKFNFSLAVPADSAKRALY